MKSYIKKFSGIIYILSLVLCFVSCKPDVVVSDTTAPGCVTNVNAESEEGKIVLTWTDPSDSDLLGIKIYNGTEVQSRAVSFSDGILVGKGIQKYEVTNLEDGKKYTFRISAVDTSLNESEKVTIAAVKFSTKEKLVYTTAVKAGTYTVYHLQQNTSGGKAISDYVLESTESNKSVAAESTIADLKKTYTGFTEKTMAQNETAIYVFYDRKTITYTFQTGTEGKFEDGSTSKEVSGLYGASYIKPKAPRSGDYNFVKWQDSSENAAPSVFGAEDKTWTAVWKEKSAGGTPDYSTCVVGDFILKDGIILSKDSTPGSGTVAAVIVRAATEDKPALGVGIVHNISGLAWCTSNAAGYEKNITALQGDKISGYMDGSDGWEQLKAACPDAAAGSEYYPAWNYSLTYATTNGLTGDLADGWYLPTVAELYTIYQNKTTVNASLSKAGGSQFGTSMYWSCCQYPSYDSIARILIFDYGHLGDSYKYDDGFYVCSVRAFN